MDLKNNLEKIFNIKIINLYGYGSKYYGTATDKSDLDFKIISDVHDEIELNNGTYNIHVVSKEFFITELNGKHNMGFIEAYFHPIYTEIDLIFIFNKDILKHAASSIADNSYVKAKKKLAVEAKKAIANEEKEFNFYKAKKSLFHAFRTLDFAIQMCENDGRIIKWDGLVPLFNEIMALPNDPDSWETWNGQFRNRYNVYKSKFRLVR